MHRFLLVLLTIILLLGVVGIAPTFAEDPAVGTPADNACNPGGSMEGKCDSDWAWTCGYHLARWQAAGEWNGNYPMVAECMSILPPPPPGIGFVGCANIEPAPIYYIMNGVALQHGAIAYADANCQIPFGNAGGDFVYVPPGYDPAEMCLDEGFGGNAVLLYGNVWECN